MPGSVNSLAIWSRARAGVQSGSLHCWGTSQQQTRLKSETWQLRWLASFLEGKEPLGNKAINKSAYDFLQASRSSECRRITFWSNSHSVELISSETISVTIIIIINIIFALIAGVWGARHANSHLPWLQHRITLENNAFSWSISRKSDSKTHRFAGACRYLYADVEPKRSHKHRKTPIFLLVPSSFTG